MSRDSYHAKRARLLQHNHALSQVSVIYDQPQLSLFRVLDMPGPRNTKKSKKKQAGKNKARSQKNALKEVEQNVSDNLIPARYAEIAVAETCLSPIVNCEATSDLEQDCLPTCSPPGEPSQSEHTTTIQPTTFSSVSHTFDNPFITNPGNGPRVKDTEAFLTSFFCPPLSLEDKDCAAFAREEVLTVLEAVLPTREVALVSIVLYSSC